MDPSVSYSFISLRAVDRLVLINFWLDPLWVSGFKCDISLTELVCRFSPVIIEHMCVLVDLVVLKLTDFDTSSYLILDW